MASKEEIIATIQQGTAEVEQTFASLSDEQLRTRVHEGDGGWTAKQVLAHLAARQPVNDRLFSLAAGEGTPLTGDFDPNHWNQIVVDQHMNQSRDALLAEFAAVQEGLITQVQTMSDDTLARPIPLPQGEATLGDVLAMAGGMHAGHHAQEVQQALAQSPIQPERA
ncbi:MAG TPA: DinB family protein [Chloroflexota bacterium]|nr:DinB family protein [Chloroflexota bacterium]